MVIGVVLAGGVGSRYGAKLPKQYLTLCGQEVINYPIKALKNSKNIDAVIVACDKQFQERIQNIYNVEVCDSGSDRNITVQNALDYISAKYPECQKVIFVDSARPLCTHYDVDECIQALDNYDVVITGQKITDSLGCYFNNFVNRDDYYLIQTPEAFKFNTIKKNFNINSTATALCQQMPKDTSLYIYFGMKNNNKITYMGDISYIENNFSDNLEK